MESYIVLAFIAAFTTLTIGSIIWSGIRNRKRVESLQSLAKKLQLKFSPVGDEELHRSFENFELFNKGRFRKLKNLIEGKTDDVAIAVFDYTYMTGGGKSKRFHTQTVTSIRSANLQVGDFRMRPEGLLERASSMMGFQDIDFDSHPEFSKMYVLQGKSEQAVRELFQPDILEYFESKPRLTFEGREDTLIMFERGRRLTAEQIEQKLSEVLELQNTFSQSMQMANV